MVSLSKTRVSPSSKENENEIEIENEIMSTTNNTDNNDRTPRSSPTIVNNTEYPIVVFLERGVLYNKQVLYPGEAVTMTRKQTGGGRLLRIPYKVHAVIGNETALPTRNDSIKNVVRVSAVPAAFVAGCLVTAASAGTLAGPSIALAPLISGLVVQGVVIDAAVIAAGTIAADRAQKIAEMLLTLHKEKLMCVTSRLKPGHRYLSVTGGLIEGPVVIKDIPYPEFDRLSIKTMKVPIITTARTTTTKKKDNEATITAALVSEDHEAIATTSSINQFDETVPLPLPEEVEMTTEKFEKESEEENIAGKETTAPAASSSSSHQYQCKNEPPSGYKANLFNCLRLHTNRRASRKKSHLNKGLKIK